MFCPSHRSMVAWCMGVLVVLGMTALNGPFLRGNTKVSTLTLVLRGLLWEYRGNDVWPDVMLNNPFLTFPTSSVRFLVAVNSLCVSKLCTSCLCVLRSPVVAAHTPPTCSRTVHLQDELIWGEAHWREGWYRENEESFQTLLLSADTVRKFQVYILPGNVVLTLKSDRQVSSSSPPAQSFFPSQALFIGINLTERLQKKYLFSISFLTTQKSVGRVGMMQVRNV